jgi:hypothetical protein
MKVNLEIVRKMVMEYIHILMEMNIKVLLFKLL